MPEYGVGKIVVMGLAFLNAMMLSVAATESPEPPLANVSCVSAPLECVCVKVAGVNPNDSGYAVPTVHPVHIPPAATLPCIYKYVW